MKRVSFLMNAGEVTSTTRERLSYSPRHSCHGRLSSMTAVYSHFDISRVRWSGFRNLHERGDYAWRNYQERRRLVSGRSVVASDKYLLFRASSWDAAVNLRFVANRRRSGHV